MNSGREGSPVCYSVDVQNDVIGAKNQRVVKANSCFFGNEVEKDVFPQGKCPKEMSFDGLGHQVNTIENLRTRKETRNQQ